MRAIKCPCSLSDLSDGWRIHLAELFGDHLNDPLGGLCCQFGEKYTPSQAVLRFKKVDQFLGDSQFTKASGTMYPEDGLWGVSYPVGNIPYNVISTLLKIFVACIVWMAWQAVQ